MLNRIDIGSVLPHRYPFLLIDRILAIEPGRKLEALKCVSAVDDWRTRLADPVDCVEMPPMLVVEAMAQAGGVLLLADDAQAADRVVYFASLDRVRWHGSVVPGDRLLLEVTVIHARGRLRKVRAEARVEGVLVCEAELAAVVIDR